jgi:hypothetical protein
MIGQPFFVKELDEINPIGSLIISLCYIFYDVRLGTLEKSGKVLEIKPIASFDFIKSILVTLAN